MDLHINLFNILILFGMLQSFVFAGILFMKSKFTEAHKHLAITIIILALYLGWVLKYDFGFQHAEPRLQHLPLVFLWGIGPSFYAYIRHQLGDAFNNRELKRHYFPLLLEFVLFILVNSLTFFEMQALLEKNAFLNFLCWNYFSIDHLLGMVSMFFYFVLSWKVLKPFWKHERAIPLKRLLVAFGLIWLIWVPYTLYDAILFSFNFPPSEFYLFYILLAGLTYTLGLIGFQVKKNQLIKTSNSWKLEDQRQLNQLINLLEKEKWYLKPDLTKQEVSLQLALHPNRLSYLVNKGLNCGFRDLLNQYRVNHLKKKLSNSENFRFTILSLGYECGFNSKASLNRIFKNHVGLTPQEYRKKTTQNAF